jgi:plasmid maintenance system antidote protein VapI
MATRRAGREKGPTVTEILKQAIQDSGLPLSKLAEEAEVPIPSLTRFMRGERSLTLKVAEKLIAVVGIRVLPPDGKAKGK